MKQTNNAIKYLMAQYRAIYKFAFLSGSFVPLALLSSLALAPLASAQAVTNIDTIQTLQTKAKENNNVINIDNKTYSLAITSLGNPTADGKDLSNSARSFYDISINITSGAGHKIDVSSSTTEMAFGLRKLSVSGKDTKLQFGTIDGKSSDDNAGKVLNIGFVDGITLGAGTETKIYAQVSKTEGAGSLKALSTTIKGGSLTINGKVELYNQHGSNSFLIGDYNSATNAAKVDISGEGAQVILDATSKIENEEASKSSRSVLGWRTEIDKDTDEIRKLGNEITVSNKAKLTLNAAQRTPGADDLPGAYGAAVWGSSLTVDNATLEAKRLGGRIETKDTIFRNSVVDLADATTEIYFVPRYGNVYNKKSYDNTNTSRTRINGLIKFENSTLTNRGVIRLQDGGTLSIDDKSKITAGASEGRFLIGLFKKDDSKSYKHTTNPTLKISSKQLKSYLTSGENLGTGITDYQGMIQLNEGGRIEFSDIDAVDLAQFSFGTYGSPSADALPTFQGGKIVVGTPSTGIGNETENKLAGDIRLVSDKLIASKDLGAGAANITLEAKEKLTLGSSDKDLSNGINFKDAYTKNLAFASSNNKDFKLTQTINLKSTRAATIDGKDIADNGFIEGNVVLAKKASPGSTGTLKVDGGIYTANGKITLQEGNINLTNSSNLDISSLALTGSLVIDASKTNNLEVSGGTENSLSSYNSILDLSDAYISYVPEQTRNNLTSFKANKGGLIVFSSQAEDLLTNEKSNASLILNGGKIELNDDLALASANIKGQSLSPSPSPALSSGSIFFDTTSGGILDLGSHKLSLSATEAASATVLDIGAQSSIWASSLELNSQQADKSAQEVQLKSGVFNISSSLDSLTNSLVNISGATLNLGYYDQATKLANTEQGSINTNLVLSSTGSVFVNTGSWTAKDIAISGGTLNIGYASAPDIYSKEILAKLDADKLIMAATGSKVLVNKNGTLEVDQFTAGGEVNISGSMLVHGASSALADETYGVNLDNGQVKIGRDARLTFGTNALNDIAKVSSGTVTVPTSLKKISLDYNGVLKLDFANGTNINSDEIVALKTKFLTSDSFVNTNSLKGFISLGGAVLDVDKYIENKGTNGAPSLSWDKYKEFADIERNDGLTNDKLSQAVITGITNDMPVKGAVGALQLDKNNNQNSVSLGGKTLLSNASSNNGHFATDSTGSKDVTIVVKNGSPLTLAGGGIAGKVELSDANSSLSVQDGDTTISEIKGRQGNFFVNANTKVLGDIEINNLDISKSLSANKAVLEGNFYSEKDSLTKIDQELHVKGILDTSGHIQANTLKLEQDAFIQDNALISAKEVIAGRDSLIQVGRDYIAAEENNGIAQESSTGYLDVGTMRLNNATLYADPEYSDATTLVAIKNFDTSLRSASLNKDSIGVIDGSIVVGKNAAVGLGLDKASLAREVAKYQKNGALDQENIGSILYLAENIRVQDGKQIVINGDETANSLAKTKEVLNYTENSVTKNADLGLSQNGAIIINMNAFTTGEKTKNDTTAVHFDKNNAVVHAQEGGKIILAGDYDAIRKLNIFSDNDTDSSGVKLVGQDIEVRSENGLLVSFLKTGDNVGQSVEMRIDTDLIDKALSDASDPLRETLIDYNQNKLTTNVDTEAKPDTKPDVTPDSKPSVEKPSESTKPYFNSFLNAALQKDGGARSAESALRFAAYSGVVHSAFVASNTTTDAISARMGMAAQNDALSFADNGQGTALWITPVFKSFEAEGFKAQGLKYGTDLDLYGLALGADFTLANGLRVGGMFNLGSGDADGKQAGQGAKNDFDYYGFGLYAGYTLDKLSIVGDISYTVTDNELRAQTPFDLIGTNTDAKALSLGVTAQYNLALNGVDIIPHAALRFTSIDVDNYTVESEHHEDVLKFDSSRMNVFSIPVGITISKEIMAGSWKIKPSFDLTLTGQFGDDSFDGTATWIGAEQFKTATQSEVLDSFTYGATVGIAAQTGNFSLGLGANYTGSSNTDEYGLSANARFVF